MIIEANTLRYIARTVIEFKTPFLISAGESDFFSDVMFVADANGLPTIPGSSIAGILRHEVEKITPDKVNELFGFQGTGEDKEKERGSRLTVSWGCIHDSANRLVEGIVNLNRLNDQVLKQAINSLARDHVCITDRGIAKGGGKFDERYVSAGHRFTFEMMLEGSEKDLGDWHTLLSLLTSGTIRIGGKTRRGLGSFEVISLKEGIFDLAELLGFTDFSRHPIKLSEISNVLKERLDAISELVATESITASIELKPKGFWLIGGGSDSQADIAPVLESRIKWTNGKGKIGEEEVLVPGTAIKGSLAHRTAYYYNALSEVFLDDLSRQDIDRYTASNNDAIRELFGYCKNDAIEEDGQRGRVFIDDIFIGKPEQKIVNHVAIDRFTGGAKTMSGALFSERPFFKGNGFELKLTITEPDKISPNARKAFALALNDMASGRLSIGSGAGRGNGFFEALNGVAWSNEGKTWIGDAV